MPKQVKFYTRRELDAMPFTEMRSLSGQLKIPNQNKLKRPELTETLLKVLTARFSEDAAAAPPPKPTFDLKDWMEKVKAAPPIDPADVRHAHIVEDEDEDDDEDTLLEELDEHIAREERLAEHQAVEIVRAEKERFCLPGEEVLMDGFPVVRMSPVVGVESGFDPIPDATERVEIPAAAPLPEGVYTAMDLSLEDLNLCFKAMAAASRQAETFTRCAEWLGGNTIRFSQPDGTRILITLPSCLTVQVQPALD